MKKATLFLLIGAISVKVVSQTPAEEADELLKQYTKQNSFNGVVLIAQKGKILLEKGYGYKNAAAKTLNDSNTVFQIGSITKQFTSAIILQLQEQHKLFLQDKLSKYIPDYPKGDSITIENLLTHTSGIYNYTNDEEYVKNNIARQIKLEELIATFKNKPFDFSPGTEYRYSNSGYTLLGYIIEKVTGESYFTIVRENIFTPLKMNHSGFDFSNLKSANKATGYIKLSEKSTNPATIVDSSESYAAGSIYTTVGDLYKWDRALYTNSIMHDSSLQKTFTPYKANYGYGWVIDSSYGKKVVMHSGEIFGFTSFIARIPSDEVCIILLDNKGSPGLAKIAENINSILNQQPYDYPKPRKEIKVDSSILKQYIGQYQLASNFIITISLEDGQVMLQATGQEKNELFAEKENFFFMKLQDIQVEFIRGMNDKVDRLVLCQYSQRITALKIK
jgi:CubicO group peptidase (beta-lactamase class C family)